MHEQINLRRLMVVLIVVAGACLPSGCDGQASNDAAESATTSTASANGSPSSQTQTQTQTPSPPALGDDAFERDAQAVAIVQRAQGELKATGYCRPQTVNALMAVFNKYEGASAPVEALTGALLAVSDHRKLITLHERVLLHKDTPFQRFFIGYLYNLDERSETAITYLEPLTKTAVDDPSLATQIAYQLALAYVETFQWQRAADTLDAQWDACLALNRFGSLLLRGQAAYNLGAYDQAEPLLREACRLNTESDQALYMLAMNCIAQGNTEDAQRFMARVAQVKRDREPLLRWNTFVSALHHANYHGNWAAAVDRAGRLIDLSPSPRCTVLLHQMRARIHLQMGDAQASASDQAAAEAIMASDVEPTSPGDGPYYAALRRVANDVLRPTRDD